MQNHDETDNDILELLVNNSKTFLNLSYATVYKHIHAENRLSKATTFNIVVTAMALGNALRSVDKIVKAGFASSEVFDTIIADLNMLFKENDVPFEVSITRRK